MHKKLLVTALIGIILMPGSVVASRGEGAGVAFSDVPASHPNAEAIAYVKDHAIVQGYEDGTFRPDHRINRAEFMKIVMEASYPGKAMALIGRCGEGERFRDMTYYEWFGHYVCLAVELVILNGYSDGSFRPGAEINFAEAAKIIIGAFPLPMYSPSEDTVWYEKYVRALGNYRAVPMSVRSFSQKITRGEMAEMIYRLQEDVTNKPSQTYDSILLLDTSVWETYRSNKYGSSFQYPGGWVVSESTENRVVVATTKECVDDSGSPEKLMEQYKQCDRFTFWIGDPVGATYGDEETLLRPLVDGEPSEVFIYNIPTQATVDGQMVYIPKASISGQVLKGGVWYKYSLTFHQGRITYATKLFTQILSTIRF